MGCNAFPIDNEIVVASLINPSDPSSDSYADIKIKPGTSFVISRSGNPFKISENVYRIVTDADSPDNWANAMIGTETVTVVRIISPDDLYDINGDVIDAIVFVDNQYSTFLVLDKCDQIDSSADISIVEQFPVNPTPGSRYYLVDGTNAGLNPYILYTPKSSYKTYKIPILTAATANGATVISYLKDTENIALQAKSGSYVYDQNGNLLTKASTQIDGTDWDYYIIANQNQVLTVNDASGKFAYNLYISPLRKTILTVPDKANALIFGPFSVNFIDSSSNIEALIGGRIKVLYNGKGNTGYVILNLPGNQNVTIKVIFGQSC
ncbi:MAG: hypothetical protein QW478_01020 [Candidatus Micrarchaeaceae archaeon]